MPKKQSTKQRTQVKDLPKKEKKLNKGELKKVKGGITSKGGVKRPIMGDDDLVPTFRG